MSDLFAQQTNTGNTDGLQPQGGLPQGSLRSRQTGQ